MRIETLTTLLVFFIVFLALIRNGESATKCTPIKMVITVRYTEEAFKTIYKREKTIKVSSSFESKYKQNKDKWDMSLSANAKIPGVGGGGFSAGGGRAWEETISNVNSEYNKVQREKETKDEFQEGFTQLYRIEKRDVTVDGGTITSDERVYLDSIPVAQSPDVRSLRKQAEEYVKYTYGDIPGGKIVKNTYTARSCIGEGRNTVNE